MTKATNIVFWTGTILLAVFFALLAITSFSEWWAVKVKKQISDYPWGRINENPWYYKTPGLYSTLMLAQGILFSVALLVLARQIARRDKGKILRTLIACFGLFIVVLINGQIK